MTVRRERRRDPKTGAEREFWIVDVVFAHADGRHQRVRKVPPIQTKRGAEAYEHQLRQSMLDGSYGREEVPTEALARSARGLLGRSRPGARGVTTSSKSGGCALDDGDV